MDEVDQFYQICATNPAQRREKPICMSIITFGLNSAQHNALVAMKAFNLENRINRFIEFKHRVVSMLTRPLLHNHYNIIVQGVGKKNHSLPHGGKKWHNWYFCALAGNRKQTTKYVFSAKRHFILTAICHIIIQICSAIHEQLFNPRLSNWIKISSENAFQNHATTSKYAISTWMISHICPVPIIPFLADCY